LWSYRLAADNLEELCGISLSHTTVGEIAANTAGEMAVKMENYPEEIRKAFQQAKGEGEFYADGTFVHIRNDEDKAEWREMKVGALAKRERGESAMPSEWNTRKLPKPTVVSAFAAIEGKEEFQERCQRERRRVGVGGISSALGDGAKWIWNIVGEVFGKTEECLDIYHGAEHISDCGKIVFGESAVRTEWFEQMRLVLISEGFAGVERELERLKANEADRSLLAAATSKPHRHSLCRPLLPPVESLLEKLLLNFYTPGKAKKRH